MGMIVSVVESGVPSVLVVGSMRATFNIPGPSFPSSASWARRDAVGVTHVEQTGIVVEHLAGKKEGDRGVVLTDLEPPALGELPDAVEPAGADIAASTIRGNGELEAPFDLVALDGGADAGVGLQVPLRVTDRVLVGDVPIFH